MKIKLNVLFDCDGTLLKSLGFGMDAWNLALAHVGARPHEPQEIIKFFGKSADKILNELLGDQLLALEAYEIYFEYEQKHVARVVPHEGIYELLKNLKGKGVRMGIVTGRHSRDLELLLTHTKIKHFFEVFICDNFLAHSKPHPEGLKLAASLMGVDTRDCLYIGDSVMDIQAAKAAGAKSVAALWDQFSNLEMMRKNQPDLLAQTPQDIWDWMSKLIGL